MFCTLKQRSMAYTRKLLKMTLVLSLKAQSQGRKLFTNPERFTFNGFISFFKLI